MKSVAVVVCLMMSCGVLSAQKMTWQPSVGHKQIPIWPGAAPDPQPVKRPETAESSGPKDLIGGKPIVGISNVTVPTMTVYSPNGENTGVAVVVFPGGGYQMLAIDLEGSEVCDWLTAKGITCVLLKYRVTDVGDYPKSGPYPESPMALEDAQRTLGLVRYHAAEWHIDPHKVGVLGFSAGGHLSAAISNHWDKRLYAAVDDADKESCRPDFAVPIYPGHLSISASKWDTEQGKKKFVMGKSLDPEVGPLALNPDLHVTRQTPPTFLLQAEDDNVDNVDDALSYYIALKNAKVPAELHLYAHGGHAFGLRHTQQPITDWPELVEKWLHTIGMIAQ
jgi:acetyl esterase/lipase